MMAGTRGKRPRLTPSLLTNWVTPLPKGYAPPTAAQADKIIAVVTGLDGKWGKRADEPMSDLAKALLVLGDALPAAFAHWDHTAQVLGGMPGNGAEALVLLRLLHSHLRPGFSLAVRRKVVIQTAFSVFGVAPPLKGTPWHRKCEMLAWKIEEGWPAPSGRHPTDQDSVLVRLLVSALEWTGEKTGPQEVTQASVSAVLRRRKQGYVPGS